MPGQAQVQALSPQAGHCRAASSSPLKRENKDLPLPHISLGRVAPRVLGRSGWVREGHWPAIHRPSATEWTLTPHPQEGSLDSWPHQPSSWRPAGNLTPALQRAPWQRLHCTLAFLHTPHTCSQLSSHPTSRPPEAQTPLDPLLQIHWAAITFTLKPTHPHTRLQATRRGGATRRPCAPGELSIGSPAGPQDRS